MKVAQEKFKEKKSIKFEKKNEFKVCLFTQVLHCHIFMSEIVSVGIVYVVWSSIWWILVGVSYVGDVDHYLF